VPTLLRLLEKYWFSQYDAEFQEALIQRYQALLKDQGDDPTQFPAPQTIKEVILAAASDLEMSLPEVIAYPE